MKTRFARTERARIPQGALGTLGVLLALVLLPGPVWAQAPDASPLEMRHFWHVFVGYAIAWVLIGGWLFTIVRRLRKLDERVR